MRIEFLLVRQTIWAAALLALGCSEATQTAAPTSKNPTADVQEQSSAETAERVAAAPANEADSPAAAVQGWIAAISSGQDNLIVDSVSEPTRKALDKRIGEWFASIDPSVRHELADAIAHFAQTARHKQEFVLNSDRVTISGGLGEFLRNNFQPVSRLMSRVAASPIWGKAEAPGFRDLVQITADAVTAEASLAEQFKGLKAVTQSYAGSEAIVTIQTPAGARILELRLIRRENQWIPAAFASLEEDAGNGADGMSRQQRLRTFTNRLNEISTALEGVQTQAEFDALADRAATHLLALAGAATETMRRVESHEFVTVIVTGELSEEEKDRILWTLVSQTDAPQSGLADAADPTEGDGLVATIGPVADIHSFASQLPGLTVENIDAETRTIRVRRTVP